MLELFVLFNVYAISLYSRKCLHSAHSWFRGIICMLISLFFSFTIVASFMNHCLWCLSLTSFFTYCFHFHFWLFNLILLVLQHFHSSCVGPSETPKVCCSCPRPSHVESGLQNQTNWWWLWWKRDKVSLSGCCGFCPVISPEPTCQTNIRQGCWYDDNWAAPQLSWQVQGTNFFIFLFILIIGGRSVLLKYFRWDQWS